MTDQSVPRQDYYVYALLREDGETPFYIGMGARNRWLQHEKTAHLKHTHKNAIILQMKESGMSVPKLKLAENLTRPEAIRLEIDMIYLIGRKPIGPLVNKTDGGEGQTNMSEETKQKLREKRKLYKHSPETLEKMRLARIGRKMGPMSEEQKDKIRQTLKGRQPTEEQRKKMRMNASHHKPTPENLEKMRQAHIGLAMPEHVRAALAKSLAARDRSPEETEKRRKSATGKKMSVQTIEKMKHSQSNRSEEWLINNARGIKKSWENPITRQKRIDSLKARWSDPEFRKSSLENLREARQKGRAARESRRALQNLAPEASAKLSAP